MLTGRLLDRVGRCRQLAVAKAPGRVNPESTIIEGVRQLLIEHRMRATAGSTTAEVTTRFFIRVAERGPLFHRFPLP